MYCEVTWRTNYTCESFKCPQKRINGVRSIVKLLGERTIPARGTEEEFFFVLMNTFIVLLKSCFIFYSLICIGSFFLYYSRFLNNFKIISSYLCEYLISYHIYGQKSINQTIEMHLYHIILICTHLLAEEVCTLENFHDTQRLYPGSQRKFFRCESTLTRKVALEKLLP